MKAVLVRVGIDQTKINQAKMLGIDQTTECKGWNAPVNTEKWEFAYVPILEDEAKGTKKIRPGCEVSYNEFKDPCEKLDMVLPPRFDDKCAHLDPDFRYLTYGDQYNKGAHLIKLKLKEDDILAFYAGLAPPDAEQKRGKLIYSLIGLYKLKGPGVLAKNILQKEVWHENAHTRRDPNDDDKDIVFYGKKNRDVSGRFVSGRLTCCINIGEYRIGDHCHEARYYLERGIQKKMGRAKSNVSTTWFS